MSSIRRERAGENRANPEKSSVAREIWPEVTARTWRRFAFYVIHVIMPRGTCLEFDCEQFTFPSSEKKMNSNTSYFRDCYSTGIAKAVSAPNSIEFHLNFSREIIYFYRKKGYFLERQKLFELYTMYKVRLTTVIRTMRVNAVICSICIK